MFFSEELFPENAYKSAETMGESGEYLFSAFYIQDKWQEWISAKL